MAIETVYFDMDGVLSDLLGNIEEELLNGESVEDALHDDSLMTQALNNPDESGYVPLGQRIHDYLLDGVNQGTVFPHLEPNPNLCDLVWLMRKLIDLEVEICVLSSLGGLFVPLDFGSDDGGEMLIEQKKEWLKKHLPHDVLEYLGPIFVPFCVDKQMHASPRKFLIDDRSYNCNNFQIAGGHSYHYGMNRHEKSMFALEGILL